MADITLGAIVAGALGARTPLLPQESVVLDLERTRMAFEDLREQHVTVTSAMADNLNMVDEIMISIDHVQAAISDGLEPVDAPATRVHDALRALMASAMTAAAAADERMRMADMVDETMDIIRSAQATISEALEPVDAPATRGRDALRTLNDDMENIIDILTLEFETELDAVHDSDDDDDDA